MKETLTFRAKEADQEIKSDAGKWRITLVPPQIIFDIAEVREYGVKKYKDPENWKRVEKARYINALFRHLFAWLMNPYSSDRESGISHLKHAACNMAFLCELQAREEKELERLEEEITA
jgi:hypothetical protein